MDFNIEIEVAICSSVIKSRLLIRASGVNVSYLAMWFNQSQGGFVFLHNSGLTKSIVPKSRSFSRGGGFA
jgi:hypothetical protein